MQGTENPVHKPHPLYTSRMRITRGAVFWEILKTVVCWRPLVWVGAPSYENTGSAPGNCCHIKRKCIVIKAKVGKLH